ncbi:FAD-dependent oxidoreductase [Streptomyces sp. BE20]|uniref:hydroxysqualene dehydroxylase n=1 Tax=unclassified Streptomyces TaxID=2593676 RepID=UPI002E760F1F|nr:MULTISPECIES: FAD-dependent oxidoreductase [unclassified Streptomyces]MED7954658.1 FAD-dependent oxidoreductase [Streptomyces sp. BE303]MEE1827335.1 FAD-dependent oxidoreductase [Streptomyces sp. BE20]
MSGGSGRTVVVLGGGVAGLTAAMELAERGFEVTVVEPSGWGGKARSASVPGTGTGGRLDLPSEHGFRFFPGFYRSLPDTMRRIPLEGSSSGVEGNLREAPQMLSARSGRIGETVADVSMATGPRTPLQILRARGMRLGAEGELNEELLYFANRMLVYMTSSAERRLGQWERTSWWDFTAADGASEEYRKVCVVGATRTVVAARAEVCSAHTVGGFLEAFGYGFLGRGEAQAADRVLNAPTSTAWIDPWVRHLERLGVRLELGWRVERLRVRGRAVVGAVLRGPGTRRREVDADWYVCALPVDRIGALLERGLAEADPELKKTAGLRTDWMVGLQFYLTEPTPITRGHVIYQDSPWALTSISQAQFWDTDFRATYGDGTVADCLSVDISSWDTPGILYGKPARECTRAEVVAEVWAQLTDALDDGRRRTLHGGLLHSWHLDPAVRNLDGPGPATNDEALLINTTGSWELRPTAETAAVNLFMAGDFVRCPVNLATMEGANQSGRAATNALLRAAGHGGEPAVVHALYEAEELRRLKEVDAALYRQGRAHILDTPPPWSSRAGEDRFSTTG